MRMELNEGACLLPPALSALLPPAVTEAVARALLPGEFPEEIRLRRDHAASVTVGGVNRRLDAVLSAREMAELLTAFCGGSLYAHGDTLRQGLTNLHNKSRALTL